MHEDMDPEKETVLLCHHGVRSMRVAGFLASQVTVSGCPHCCSLGLFRLLFLCQGQKGWVSLKDLQQSAISTAAFRLAGWQKLAAAYPTPACCVGLPEAEKCDRRD